MTLQWLENRAVRYHLNVQLYIGVGSNSWFISNDTLKSKQLQCLTKFINCKLLNIEQSYWGPWPPSPPVPTPVQITHSNYYNFSIKESTQCDYISTYSTFVLRKLDGEFRV